ncbi:MAG: OmpA family protein [Christensenellales bacterium]|jgi:chemotaxis protein MotB
MRRSRKKGGMSLLSGAEQSFSLSFAHMLSALALVLFFLVFLAYTYHMSTSDLLSTTQYELTVSSAQLDEVSALSGQAEEGLAELTRQLDETRSQLEQEQEMLSQTALALKEQEETIIWQQEYISSAMEELKKLQSDLASVGHLRLSMQEKLLAAAEKALGDDSQVEIGEDGSVIIPESLLFTGDSAEIKPAGEKLLLEIGNSLYLFIHEAENISFVDCIIISGHTDNKNTQDQNLALSADRAHAVMDFIMTGIDLDLTLTDEIFASAGYGSARPIDKSDSESGRKRNRRIEISLSMKDENVLKSLDEFLKESLPEAEEESAGE